MKDKILMLIIGILIGAIVASACFLIFGGNSSNDKMNSRDFDSSMMEDENFDANTMGGGRMKNFSGTNDTESTETSTEENATN